MSRSEYYTGVEDQFKQIYLQEDNEVQPWEHFHDSIEFVMMTKGTCEAHIAGNDLHMEEGMISFSGSYESHRYECDRGNIKAIVIVLSREYFKQFQEIYKDYQFPTFMTDKKKNREIIEFAGKWLLNKDMGYLYNLGCANVLFSIIMKKYSLVKKESSTSDVLVSDILKYIHEHFTEDISLKTISSHVGYSVEYCSKTLKAATNINFKEYLNTLRLRKVNELLSDSTKNITIQEALMISGFNSEATYYRARKQIMGKMNN